MPVVPVPPGRRLVAAPPRRCLLGLALLAIPAAAQAPGDILVTGIRGDRASPGLVASTAAIDAAAIATTINARNVEDALKYLPSLVVRKRHVGDGQAPLATRTSGLGASARSLVYADGALLSALIGNNNSNASPRWNLVSTEEIARIDVLYGPFSAAYPGNSIGAVVNITTRLPEHFEASATVATSVQDYALYGTRRVLPVRQIGATAGDRLGPLVLFAAIDHVASLGQPLGVATAVRPATPATGGRATGGGYDDRNRLGQPIRVFGATAFERQRQTRLRLKAALDLGGDLRLRYGGALLRNATEASDESYLTGPDGTPVYAGAIANGGRSYTLAPATFAGQVYRLDQRNWSHSLTLDRHGPRLDWQLIGTAFVTGRDRQRTSDTALPAGATGGAGFVTDLKGTGWRTLDAKATWRPDKAAAHVLSAGLHGDWFALHSDRLDTADWRAGAAGTLNLASRGRTRTLAAWAQEAWTPLAPVTLTIGARLEGWRAYDGYNYARSPAIGPVVQPARRATRTSPKASLAFLFAPRLTARLSWGQAWRFPTVGELYQVVTTPVAAVPDPTLRPERARSTELALERAGRGGGSLRLSLFAESVRDALIAQTGALPVAPVQLGSFVQNVGRTRARGVEFAGSQPDLLPRLDVQGSVTFAHAVTARDDAFPAALGRQLPSVPRWKASAVVTWRPAPPLALTAAARYASRNWGTLDHSDVVGNTYGGFYRYFVVDLRAQVRVGERLRLGIGIDNVNDDRYFLFHPFPQRTLAADATIRL